MHAWNIWEEREFDGRCDSRARLCATSLHILPAATHTRSLRTTMQQVTLLIQPSDVLTCTTQHIWYTTWRTNDKKHLKLVLYILITFHHMHDCQKHLVADGLKRLISPLVVILSLFFAKTPCKTFGPWNHHLHCLP